MGKSNPPSKRANGGQGKAAKSSVTQSATLIPHARAIVTHSDQVENYALYGATIIGGLFFLLAFILNWGRESVPLVGDDSSLASMTAYAAVVIALIIAPIAFFRGAKWRAQWSPGAAESNWQWRIVPVTIGALLVTLLMVIFGFIIANAAFPAVHINWMAAPISIAVIAGALAYFVARSFYYVRAPGLILITVIALMGTLMFAGALNDDPLWYEGSFSGLGMTESNSRSVFNYGLVITGLLIVAWSQFLLDDLRVLIKYGYTTEKYLNWMRILFIVAGVFLGMVGVVRWGIGFWGNVMHDLFAGGAGAALAIVLVGMYWFIPHFVKWFYYMSWGLLALIAMAVILKIVGYFSLTGLELMGFGAASLWLLMFMRSAQNLVNRVDPKVYAMPEARGQIGGRSEGYQ